MRCALLCVLMVLTGMCAEPAHAVRSSLYPADWEPGFTDGTGRFLHDFSYAGYRNGEPVPPETGAFPVLDVVADFSADNTGASDSTPAIQTAINAAQAGGGGIVHFPAGMYRCDGLLTIGASNIILRGAGEAATFVYFTSVPAGSGAGHITFTGSVVHSQDTPLAEDGENRSFTVRVTDASPFAVGDDIAVGWVITEEFVAEHGMTGTWVVFSGQWKPFFRREIVEIDTNVSPHVITLDVPLRYAAKLRDGASIRLEQGYLEGCGVEDMALSNAVERTAAWSQDQVHVLGMTGVKDAYIHNVYSFASPAAEDTSEKHLQSSGIRISGSKRVTVAGCRMEKAQHRGEGGNGYLFEVRQSNEILYRDCVARDGRHNFIQNWDFGATGLVWLRCDSAGSVSVTLFGGIEIPVRAYSEYHHSLVMASLVDSCVFSDGWATGNRGSWSSGAGHTATETVLWNTTGRDQARLRSFNYGHGYVIGTEDIEVYVESDVAFGTLHVGTAPVDFTEFLDGAKYLRPQSLYESQRNRRLGLPEPEEGELPPSELALLYDGPNPVSGVSGGRVEIEVTVQDSVGPLSYQWYRLEDKALEMVYGATGPALVFDPLAVFHAGAYVCLAEDEIGSAQSPAIVLLVDAGLPLVSRHLVGALVAVFGLAMMLAQKTGTRRRRVRE